MLKPYCLVHTIRAIAAPLCIGLLIAAISVLSYAQESMVENIIDEHWAWVLSEYPEMRLEYGDRSGNTLWSDVSPSAHQRRYEQQQAFVNALTAIEPSSLGSESRLNRTMLLRELRDDIADYENGMHLMAINMRSGPQHQYTMAERLSFTSEQDYRDWLERLKALPSLLTQTQRLLQQGIAQQRTQADIVMRRVPDQISRVITDDITNSPYYAVFRDIPDAIDTDTAKALKINAQQVISEIINPAYRRFGTFMADEYLSATRQQPGLGSLPQGKAAYRQQVAKYTTTDLTPEAIHQIGIDEVARIRHAMLGVIDAVGFEGDIEAFNEFLRTDPQFYYSTPEALLEGYQAISKRLDPQLIQLFGKLPRMPYGVRPIPAAIAPDTTTAYYMRPAVDGSRPGWYYVNLYRPEVRPIFEMEVLSVHESVPGHHLQIALAQELGNLPHFRRNSSVTAFIEGWGLYSERLGYDMGLYQDPYSRYGQLVYDMWRAVRLVVDTGIHYFGWTRQQAIDYFKANAAKTEADIINEIDRYIGWPGQALAYKIGQLKILALRTEAVQALGDKFDIRAFHDELLGAGAIPLDALEARMREWLHRTLNSTTDP